MQTRLSAAGFTPCLNRFYFIKNFEQILLTLLLIIKKDKYFNGRKHCIQETFISTMNPITISVTKETSCYTGMYNKLLQLIIIILTHPKTPIVIFWRLCGDKHTYKIRFEDNGEKTFCIYKKNVCLYLEELIILTNHLTCHFWDRDTKSFKNGLNH